MKRRLKTQSKQLLRNLFELGQRFNIDILPRHFYSEIPDIHTLRSTTHWRSPRSFVGVSHDLDSQVDWVDRCTSNYRANLKGFEIHQAAVKMNCSDEGYGEIEADFLYCFVRAVQPKQIIQVGCGVSTAVCLLAAQDEGFTPTITCIEPYPSAFLKRESEAGRINLVARKLQDVGIDCLSSLGANDLFFVDSSHTLSPAGEVNMILLEMLPRIPDGAYIHFHDIHFPYDYNPDMLTSALFFPHETALMYAFLLMNKSFEIAASLAMLYHLRYSDLVRIFPAIQLRRFEQGLALNTGGNYPSSIFLRRIAGA
jgi:predicted O-methyltransferase YrrM